MAEREALLRAIRESPDEDAPRLVYADWLDEHGEAARAELIRVQCELARLAEGDPPAEGLRNREQSLLRKHERVWRNTLPDWTAQARFERGFLGRVEATPAELERDGDALWWREPVSALSLVTPGPDQV